VHVRLSVYVIAILVGLPIGGVVVPSSAFEPGWGTAVSLKIGGGDALYPQVAVDPRGNAIVLWFQYDENPSDGADGNLWAARFTPLEGWGAPVIVSRLNALTADGQSGWYRVATDSRGNTFAIWVDHERATHLSTVLASRFVPEAGWGPSESFDESDVGGAGVGGPPQIAFDGQGNAIAVWTKGSDTAASRYVLDVGWDQATQVGVPYEGGTCDIGFGDAGDAVLACWSARERGHLVWASRYVAGIGWEAPTILDPAPFGHWIDLAVDPAGNALVAWQVWNVSTRRSSMSLSRYTAGVGWGAASLIEAVGSENLTGPMVAADSRGGALAVWAEGRDPWNLGERVFALRYTPGAGWGVPETITLGAVPVGRPHLAGTASGEAVAAWIHRDGDWASVWGVPFDPDTGWGNPLRIGPEFTVRDVYPDSEELYGLSSPPRVAMDSSGNAFVVWDQFDGAQHNIWANRFVVFPWTTGATLEDLGALEDRLAQTQTALTTAQSMIQLLLAIQVVFGISTVVLAVLYRRTRGGNPGPGARLTEMNEPDGALSLRKAGLGQEGPRIEESASFPKRMVDRARRNWPTVHGPTRVTAKERILLHLLDFARQADAIEVPPELMQAGIADETGIDLRHFAQYIRPLVRGGLVRERTAHVKGNLHRRKVYGLTEIGRKRAMGIRDRLRSVVVRVQDASGSREATIADVLADAGGSLSILDIVRKSLRDGVVKLRR